MSTVGFVDLPQEIFSGRVTYCPPSELPPGGSPACQDVQFQMGAWLTRPGIGTGVYPAIAGAPNINGIAKYITPEAVKRVLALDAVGNLWKETAPGALSLAADVVTPGMSMQSCTAFGRQYCAFFSPATGLGADLPRAYNDVDGTFDRISQIGPGAIGEAADATDAGNVSVGTHQWAVIFVTRSGYRTAPSPVGSWSAAGSLKVNLTGIPIGPTNVVARIIAFTAANLANFFIIPPYLNQNFSTFIADNTTTTIEMDFDDTTLQSAENVDEYFNKVELQECAALVSYSGRLFAFGERANLSGFANLTFDGGWALGSGGGGGDLPLGWGSAADGGGTREQSDVVWGDAYRITGDGVTAKRGTIINQLSSSVAGTWGYPVNSLRLKSGAGNVPAAGGAAAPGTSPVIVGAAVQPNTSYSVRARIARSAALAAGTMHVNATFGGTSVGPGLAVAAAQASEEYVEFTAVLMTPQATVVSGALSISLNVYADGTPGPSGESFLIDNIEIFQTDAEYNLDQARASLALDPESFDGVTGILQASPGDGQTLTTGFRIRDNLYIERSHSLYQTSDDGTNEPSSWQVVETSTKAGTITPNGGANGEDANGEGWAVIPARDNLYVFSGGSPVPISPEIQPDWATINWNAAATMWLVVDTEKRRILVGAPTGAAATPNQIFVLDFSGLRTLAELEAYYTVRFSQYSGKILAIGDAPKWTIWNVDSNCGALVEQADGKQHTFIGNGESNGKIYDLDGANNNNFSDDGAGIPWSYTTYYGPSHQEEQQFQLGAGRKLFGYLSGYVEGSGAMQISAQPLGNITPAKVGAVQMVTPGATVAITSVQRTGGVVTVITAAPHGLTQGVDAQAVIAGVADESFDGTLGLKTVVNPQMFTCYQAGLPDGASTGGTAQRLVRDFEMMCNVLGERVAFTFSNQGNQNGCWAKMQKFIPRLKADPFAPVRGTP